MLEIDDLWVWDSWLCHDDDDRFHVFFLKAPKTLDAELRHHNASVGHAISPDLRTWQRAPDALDPQPAPAYDDLAVWTGSVVRSSDTWAMFTTGLSKAEGGRVQRIGVSTSDDLLTWRREPQPVLEADPRWYATVDTGHAETHWRDPWVLEVEGVWHLLATARSAVTGSAVVAHAISPDLVEWQVLPPFTVPSRRFHWAEVVSVVQVEGRWVMVFCCLADQMVGAPAGSGGIWSLPVPDSAFGPTSVTAPPALDLDDAVRLTTEDLYAGRPVVLGTDQAQLIAFRYYDADGRLIGGLIDPLPLAWLPDGSGLCLVGGPDQWRPADPGASVGAREDGDLARSPNREAMPT